MQGQPSEEMYIYTPVTELAAWTVITRCMLVPDRTWSSLAVIVNVTMAMVPFLHGMEEAF